MSDKMTIIPMRNLLAWMFTEYINHRSIFGISQSKFFKKSGDSSFELFGSKFGTPLGPAAGPHTQLTQNIAASYLTGGRFMELKTVQILDELEIDKPCIDVLDEGYNIEWSQELKLDESYEEYVKAWIILHLLQNVIFGESKNDGFIFNMSVGYDLKGIQSEAINNFIDGMINAGKREIFESSLKETIEFTNSRNFQDMMKKAGIVTAENNQIKSVLEDIPRQISNSVTLSTMHGCPANEIESIAKHLIAEKNLHTYIKLNPTLLGFEYVKDKLKLMGYDYLKLSEKAFDVDLQIGDAIPMLKRLREFAADHNRQFGIKLTNTLAVGNKRGRLSGEESYMSGRSLYPLTLNLAHEIVSSLDKDINISFSGGATINNVDQILNCGIYPITNVTDMLKPGGYYRLKQMADSLDGKSAPQRIDTKFLKTAAEESLASAEYKKDRRTINTIKLPDKLPLTDCYIAPCQEACPIHQDVSEYVQLVEQGKHKEAMEVIIDKNPLPHLTGYICDHECENHCTRWDYEDPIHIREIKKEAVLNGFDDFLQDYKFTPEVNPDYPKIAVIGAGSAGLSAAYYLAKSNFDVTLFDKENVSGGIAKTAVPDFRLPPEAMEKDIKFIEKHGVRFVYGFHKEFSIGRLREEGYKHICICTGAAKSNMLQLEGEYKNYSEAINFLEKYVQNESINLGKNVAVIGAGNSAMDAARSALRCDNVENVYLVYRRTVEFMPAYLEEFEETIADGVIYKELLMPVHFDDKVLRCQKMELTDYDDDGRRKVKPVEGEFIELEMDYVVSAIGETIDSDILLDNGIEFHDGYPDLNPDTLESNIPNVYMGGDVYRGPSSFVQAIADGRTIAETIIEREKSKEIDEINLEDYFDTTAVEERTDNINGSILKQEHTDMQMESSRCLACNFVCNKCVDVCPNRSNVAVKSEPDIFKDSFQILHVDGMCNDCGNCETFCPFNGLPYRDKITLFWSEEEFLESTHDGFYRISKSGDSSHFKIRINNHIQDIELDSNSNPLNSNVQKEQKFLAVLKSTIENYGYLFND